MLPEQLIYLHNQAYQACQSGTAPAASKAAAAGVVAVDFLQLAGNASTTKPEDLLQAYLSPVSQYKKQQQAELMNHVANHLSREASDEQSQQSSKFKRSGSGSKKKDKRGKSRVQPGGGGGGGDLLQQQSSASIELDARKLLQKQLATSDNGSGSQLAAQLAAAANSSSLFLPYLQSEAARRLQLQRSRSSDRDNRSASENINMSTFGTGGGCGGGVGGSKLNSNTPNRNCDTVASQRQPQQQNQTTIQIQSASSANSSCANSTSGPTGTSKESKSFFGSLFSRSSKSRRNKVSDSGEFGGATGSGSRRESRSHSRKGSKVSSTGSRGNVNNNNNNNHDNDDDDDDDDDNGYTDYDYQHHRHFQARASICSTNMWRIGPTRRCSMAVPANYPTYYRPLIQIHQHGDVQFGGQGLQTISGCLGSGHQQQQPHIHTGDYGHYHRGHDGGGDDDECDQLHSGATVGALVTAAVGTSLIRPKQNFGSTGFVGQDLNQHQTHLRTQQPLVYNNKQHQQQTLNPSSQMRSSTNQTINLLNPQVAQQQQKFAPSNNNLSQQNPQNRHYPLPPNAQQPNYSQVSPLQMQMQAQMQMPRSRSTDNRLSSIYASTATNTSTDIQVPTPPAPLRITSMIGGNQLPQRQPLDPQVLQHLQWQARHQPISRSSMAIGGGAVGVGGNGQAQILNNSSSNSNFNQSNQIFNSISKNQHAQESLSIGRALGQAYMQRLQRQPAIAMVNSGILNGQPQFNIQQQQQPRQRQSRSLQRGEQSQQRMPMPPPSSQYFGARQMYGHLTPIPSMDMDNSSDRIRRSRSYGALNQQQQPSFSQQQRYERDCIDCNATMSTTQSRPMQPPPPPVDCCGQPTVGDFAGFSRPTTSLMQNQQRHCTGSTVTNANQLPNFQQQSYCQEAAPPPPPPLVGQLYAGSRPTSQQCNCNGSATNFSAAQQQQVMPGGKVAAGTGKPLKRMPGQPNNLELIRLISEVDKAIQNAMFIAQHIDNLDEFESVSFPF